MQSAARGLLAVAVLAAVTLTVVDATYYCKAPPSVSNGRYYSTKGSGYTYYKVGTVIKYSCNSGYRLRGSYSQRTCYYSRSTRTYQWTGYAPSCICKFLSSFFSLIAMHNKILDPQMVALHDYTLAIQLPNMGNWKLTYMYLCACMYTNMKCGSYPHRYM